MKNRIISRLDDISHALLDGYIDAQRPGWGRLQHLQWRLCNAYDHSLDSTISPWPPS